MTSVMPAPESALPLGIGALDKVVPGVPEGQRVVFVNEPGVELAPVLGEAAASHLEEGREVVYVVLDRSPESVVSQIERLDGPEGGGPHLIFVDAFSSMLGSKSDAPYALDDPEDPDALLSLLETIASEHPEAVVIVDSLSGLVDRVSMGSVRARFTRLADALAGFRSAIVAFTAWPYEDPYEDMFKALEGHVQFGRVREGTVLGDYFQIQRVAWAPQAPTGARHLYKVIPPTGVHVYIPKIVVTGPSNAGKSSFVEAASDEAVSVDRLGTTVALDHGHVTVEGITADLFGTPGQVRFDPVLRTVAGQALGVIILVDTTRPSSYGRVRDLLQKTHSQGLPVILAASKQDLEDAADPSELANAFTLPEDVEVLGCSARDPDTCRHVLDRMIARILEERRPR